MAMMVNEMSDSMIESNGMVFTRTDYNGISVLVDEQGYYNASKICSDNGTKFTFISRTQYWTDYIDKLSSGCYLSTRELSINRLNTDGYSREVQGVYIHPKLVNWLCMHLDMDYAIKVSEIMDLINERVHIQMISLEEEIQELQEENKQLKKEVSEFKSRAVPKGTNRKLLRIIQHVDGDYQLIADQSISDKKLKMNGCKIIKHFIFPSAMHVRQVASDLDKERIKMMRFEPCTYREVYEVITSEHPIDEW